MDTHAGDATFDEDQRQKQSRWAQRRPTPVTGDILASESTARADLYAISVVPAGATVITRRYADAIEKVREMARDRSVDGWYTCDHTHYARIARHRRQ